MKLIKVAAASLNQTPLAWEDNCANIKAVIELARSQGVSILCLPELAITGYGCEDAFLSPRVQDTAFDYLLSIAEQSKGIIVGVGLPLSYRSQVFSAACLLVDGKVAGFGAKRFLAAEGIHYEPRWFKSWAAGNNGTLTIAQQEYPIGDLVFDCSGVKLGFEICQDAWVAGRPAINLARQGVEVILNPSASHFAFDKFAVRQRFVIEASRSLGVLYLYANLVGNEAGRVIYDGGELIASGGKLLACGRRFTFDNLSLTTAVVDLEQNRLLRSYPQSGEEEDETFALGKKSGLVKKYYVFPEQPPELTSSCLSSWESSLQLKEEEFARAVSLGLFDYLRKSRAQGFVVSLSGGADSTTVSCLVALMVRFAVAEIGVAKFVDKLNHINSLKGISDEKEIIGRLLTCVYQATSNSSETTRKAAQTVAMALGAEYYFFDIDHLVEGYKRCVADGLKTELKWDEHDLALQNIQARTRGPLVWLIANLKNALLLATSNRSEAAVGYATMDGDTCGGLSPIAGVDKAFILQWLKWLEEKGPEDCMAIGELSVVNSQQPTAELRPADQQQTDENDLMPYQVLEAIEDFAIRDKKVPVEVLQLLRPLFPQYDVPQLSLWVKRFFTLWCQNQWKRERFAPSFHLDDKNLDPKTWCRFPILSGGFQLELRQLGKTFSPND